MTRNYCCIECGNLICCQTALHGSGRCEICQNNLRFGKYNSNYRHGQASIKHFCKDCGKQISYQVEHKLCRNCYIKFRMAQHITKNYCCKECGNNICEESALFGTGLCRHCLGNLYSITKIGKNNSNYRNGFYIKNNKRKIKFYPTEFNEKLKSFIRNRDNNICQMCGRLEFDNNRKLDVHHIDYNKQNCKESNLISLCNYCHNKTNFDREYWIEFFKIKMIEGIKICR